MASVRAYMKTSYINNKGEGSIYVTFYINRVKLDLPTKVSTTLSSWNVERQTVTVQDKQHKDKNLLINKIKARVNDIMVKYRLRNVTLTKDAFIKEYNRPSDYETFFDYIKDYHKKHSREIEATTLRTHKVVINKLKKYNPYLHFDDITADFVQNYYWFLRKELDNGETTAYKNMSIIKKYVRRAMKSGYILQNPFEDFKIKRQNGSFTYLTEDELQRLVDCYTLHELEENYHNVLRFFLFMCFTSLHIGDAKTLQLEQIGKDSFTYFRIKNRNSKPEPIIVPLSDPAKQIIKEIVSNREKGPIFENLIADQKINEYLKKIAEICGIKKPISCKSGRHTFATIYLRKTKDLASLKEILGHSELRETLIYAHVLDESKQEGIQIFKMFKLC